MVAVNNLFLITTQQHWENVMFSVTALFLEKMSAIMAIGA